MPSFYVSSKGIVGKLNLLPEGAIIVHKYRLDFERKLFVKVSDFRWDVKVKVEIHAASIVEESLTGQYIPVLLVSQQSNDTRSTSSTFYLVYIDLVSDKFVPLRKFVVNSKILLNPQLDSQSGNNTLNEYMTVLDGPSVAVFSKLEVAVYYCDKGTALKQFVFNFKNGFQECCKDFKSSVKFKESLGITKIDNRFLLFILFQNCAKCSIHGSENENVVKVLQFFEDKFMVLNADQFIPSEYYENLTCVLIKSLKHIGPATFHSEMFLGTSEGFLVNVKNGNFINCNNICDNQPITSLKMRNDFSGESTGILAFTENVLYELTSELQVRKQYEGVIHAIIGDPLKNGSSQYLLLKQNLSEGNSWALTDWKTTILSSDDHDDGDGEQRQVSGSSTTAIKALKARLQKEQILLHEEELRTRRRADFLSDMFKKQVSIAAGVTPNPDIPQSCTINLIEGKEDDYRQQYSTESRPSIKVKGHWQRTYEDIWCVGVDVECNSKRSTKTWLEVVLDSTHTKTLKTKSSCLTLLAKQSDSHHSDSQITNKRTSCKGSQPDDMVPVKRQKIVEESLKFYDKFEKKEGFGGFHLQGDRNTEKEAGTSVCVLPLPMLGYSNSVTANLILNWTYPKKHKVGYQSVFMNHEDEGGDMMEGDNGRVYTRCCGNVTLTSKDIISGKYELNFIATLDVEDQEMEDFKEMRNNQLAWQHIQTIHSLVVKGNPGSLARLESLLTHTCGFLYNQHYDCYVNKVKALASVQVQLEPHTTDDGRLIKIYTRNDKDLCLTIHHLYANLPDNMVILPKENSSCDIVRTCAPALQKEADFLSHGLRKLLNDHEAENASPDTDDENDECDVRKVGEKFKRKREKMLRKQNDVINDEKLKQFIEQYKKVRDMTDLVIATKGKVQCNS